MFITYINLNLKKRGFRQTRLNRMLLKIKERQILSSIMPSEPDTETQITCADTKVRAKNSLIDIQMRKNEKIYKRKQHYEETLFFTQTRNLVAVQSIVKEVNRYGGFNYSFDEGLSMDPVVFNGLPELLQAQVKFEIKNIHRLFDLLYEAELQARLYNVYFYLLELKRQKYLILDKPLNEARITAQEWREYSLSEVVGCQGALIKIEQGLVDRGQLVYYYHDNIQYIMSDIEARGGGLNLKDDYRIGFNEWLKTDRSISLEMSELNLSFPFNDLIFRR